MTNYKPIPRDIVWVRNVNAMLVEGGKIGYPATQLIYKVSRVAKSWTLTNPEQLADPESKEVHERTVVVLKEIGWNCTEVTP